MPASIPDPLTPSPNSSGIFFHTLRQANASAENMDTSDSTTIAGRLNTTSCSAATTAVAAPRLHERDVENDGECVPAVLVDSNTSSHDTINADTNNDSNVDSCGNNNAATSPAVAPTGGSSIKILPCGHVVANNSKEDRGWRKIVRNFTPSWFSVSMGTGVVSILLHNLPYNAHWVWYISVIVFCLNIFLFTAFSLITITRYVLYPEIWNVMIKHPSQSLFLGCIPMSFSSAYNSPALSNMILPTSLYHNANKYSHRHNDGSRLHDLGQLGNLPNLGVLVGRRRRLLRLQPYYSFCRVSCPLFVLYIYIFFGSVSFLTTAVSTTIAISFPT